MSFRESGVRDASKSTVVVYKIDMPANRYDLLCVEGLALALRIFLGTEAARDYEVLLPTPDEQLTVFVRPEVRLRVCVERRRVFGRWRLESVFVRPEVHLCV